MKRTVKNKIAFAFIVTAISILFLGITGVYAFQRTSCNSSHSELLNGRYSKASDYGWNQTDTKNVFMNGCSQTATAILNKCYAENDCSKFRYFLAEQENACNSFSPQAKQDGCFEMRRQWTNLYDKKKFSSCLF